MCRLPRALAARYSQRLRWTWANVQTPQIIFCSLFPKGSGGPGQMCRLPRAFAARYSPKAQVDLDKCADTPEHLLLAIPKRLRSTWANVQTPQGICCSLFHKGSGGPWQMCRLPRAFAARYSPKAKLDLGKCADSPEHLLLAFPQKAQVDHGKCADSLKHFLLAIPQRLRCTWANVQTLHSICCSLFPKGSGGLWQICTPHSICCSLFHKGSVGPGKLCRLPRAFSARYSPKA